MHRAACIIWGSITHASAYYIRFIFNYVKDLLGILILGFLRPIIIAWLIHLICVASIFRVSPIRLNLNLILLGILRLWQQMSVLLLITGVDSGILSRSEQIRDHEICWRWDLTHTGSLVACAIIRRFNFLLLHLFVWNRILQKIFQILTMIILRGKWVDIEVTFWRVNILSFCRKLLISYETFFEFLKLGVSFISRCVSCITCRE